MILLNYRLRLKLPPCTDGPQVHTTMSTARLRQVPKYGLYDQYPVNQYYALIDANRLSISYTCGGSFAFSLSIKSKYPRPFMSQSVSTILTSLRPSADRKSTSLLGNCPAASNNAGTAASPIYRRALLAGNVTSFVSIKSMLATRSGMALVPIIVPSRTSAVAFRKLSHGSEGECAITDRRNVLLSHRSFDVMLRSQQPNRLLFAPHPTCQRMLQQVHRQTPCQHRCE